MNFAYIIGDNEAKLVAVFDPSGEDEKILKLAEEKDFKIIYVILTHSHPDHTEGASEIAAKTGAKIVAHKLSRVEHEISVDEGDILTVGKTKIKVIHTPGHTPDGICILVDNKLLTGDTLFVEGIGRTDLPGSDNKQMRQSLIKLLKLDDDIEIYPGHDYGSKPSSTIGCEKRANPFLS